MLVVFVGILLIIMGGRRPCSWEVEVEVNMMVAMVALVVAAGMAEGQLQVGYYDHVGCTGVEQQVRSSLRMFFATDATAPAAMLRVAFHDCQVGPGGCDASIMLAGANSEMNSNSNFGVRRLGIIDSVKSDLESMCPNTVSCADIIALAGREAVFFSNGPEMQIPLGRKDATSSSTAEADNELPPAFVSVDNMLRIFGSFGMTTAESVAILGAHSIGVSHCKSIQNRLQGQDPSLGFAYNAQLQATCAVNVFNLAVISNDITNFRFDNQYYRDVQNGRGLLTIDSLIGKDPRTAPVVAMYAANQNAFYAAFESAYLKMTSRALTGNQGVVRATCEG